MDFLLVDSLFFSQPLPAENAPVQRSHRFLGTHSRVVDFLCRLDFGQYFVTYNENQISTWQDLQNSVNQALFSPGVPGHPNTPVGGEEPLDRVYYENNWPYARSFLCRRFVKGLFDNLRNPPAVGDREDASLVRFQQFLFEADKRNDLEFYFSRIGPTSNLSMLTGRQRLLVHFGFDWISLHRSPGIAALDTKFKELYTLKAEKKFIVRRRTCVASILSMRSTDKFRNVELCPASWASVVPLLHRRTLILFNEFHSEADGLGFKDWLTDPGLWTVIDQQNTSRDTETTAVVFIYRLVCRIWERVLLEWRRVLDQSSEHIKVSETRALDDDLDVADLEELARQTWRDSQDWSTMSQLLLAQRKTIAHALGYLEAVSRSANLFPPPATPTSPSNEIVRLERIISEFNEMEQIVSQEFPNRGRNISDFVWIFRLTASQKKQRSNRTGQLTKREQVYNIIGARNAQAAENYSREMGNITWITFIFFPLITVSGLFGMNVDVLVDNPSIKWYFVVAVPLTLLVVGMALFIRRHRRRYYY
ncbi:hypothetical protein Z517_05170 [Fonsecaea pedrosoi CBS 271.37]|uniref:Uncharacterized protein n=1 Tax=Fonsecaea pedrosoi CBS 271.37 TaxID=1442368 RepID=A0A0D2GMF7_9EURO|nr:uncharacterized protein Z517_05170 [Fonsecaea pedrosoi CBS 271.37]KIW82143.1 hypothetical protein Z517_05170 [Fonsecaea pedrosoi CBS 271.37]